LRRRPRTPVDAFPDATIPDPSEAASVGDLNEGAAVVEGTVEFPDTPDSRRVPFFWIGQTEHQR
jgi:hypothetical protein